MPGFAKAPPPIHVHAMSVSAAPVRPLQLELLHGQSQELISAFSLLGAIALGAPSAIMLISRIVYIRRMAGNL
jgi:hypothetical protein